MSDIEQLAKDTVANWRQRERFAGALMDASIIAIVLEAERANLAQNSGAA